MTSIFSMKNLEKNSMRWIGAFLVTMFVIYGLASLGKLDFLRYIAVVIGFFLAGFLFVESQIISYLKNKKYRNFDVGDVIVVLSILVSVAIFINSLLLLNIINESAPQWLIKFSMTTGVVVAVIGAILSIIHFFFGKFE